MPLNVIDLQFPQMLTDFRNSFTVGLSNQNVIGACERIIKNQSTSMLLDSQCSRLMPEWKTSTCRPGWILYKLCARDPCVWL